MDREKILLTSEMPAPIRKALESRYSIEFKSARPVDMPFLNAAKGAFAVVTAPGDLFDRRAIMSLPPSVKGIVSYSAGLDHVDLSAARERGLVVTNTPDVLTEATADLTMLLILSAARGASAAERMLRDGAWSGWRPSQIFGLDLRGRTLGVFGYGRIGRAVARRAAAFGLSVVHYDRHGRCEGDGLSKPISDLDRFWAAPDILSLHAPSTDETRRIVNWQSLAAMRRGVILINTARGDLLDDDAVTEAAQSGHLAALGLDVYAKEPELDERYLSLPRATLLPHMGSSTEETRAAMGSRVLANLAALARGELPPDHVG